MEENQISKFESIKSYEYKNLPLLKLMLEKCLLRFDGEHLLSLERSCAENFSKKALNARNLVKEQIEKIEIITIQVGQCGNQIGGAFWDLLLQEHASFSKKPEFDESMSSFFKNCSFSSGKQIPFQKNTKSQPLQDLKARKQLFKSYLTHEKKAVVIDMEEGVLNRLLKSKLGSLFDNKRFIEGVSGSGNNWAHGFNEYGPEYRSTILEALRKTSEECDSLQSFFLMHSLGGGTGSGLGSYILTMLEDHFPNVFRFTASVFPSEDDDVNTSPYNSLLASTKLIEHADCVLPIDNDSLIRMISGFQDEEEMQDEKEKKAQAYRDMNSIIAHLLSNLTCSMRFPGSLNVDMNEITMNLVPYPRMHFLVSSISPIYSIKKQKKVIPRNLDQVFLDALNPKNQLIECNPHKGLTTAMGFLLRGDISFSDVSRNIEKISKKVNMIDWNTKGYKYGICSVKNLNYDKTLLCLTNNTAFSEILIKIRKRFLKLYKRKVYVHHYTQYIDESVFEESAEINKDLIETYHELRDRKPMEVIHRYRPLF